MGRAKDSASSVAGHGADGVACLSTTNGSYTGAYGSLIGTAEHPSPPSVAGSDRPLLYGMGTLRSASYLLAARNSTDDAQCAQAPTWGAFERLRLAQVCGMVKVKKTRSPAAACVGLLRCRDVMCSPRATAPTLLSFCSNSV